MKLCKLLEGVRVTAINCDADMEINEICFDSRKTGAGKAYVAARRVGADGHDYIPAAIEAGAGVIVSQDIIENYPSVTVEDGNQALALMSANLYGNPAGKMKIIGITGTKGKSTTAFNVKHILSSCLGEKVGLIGTVQYMAGDEVLAESKNSTPEAPYLHELFAKMAEKGCTYAVMEVSSHSLDIGRVAGIDYACGLFTNLSQDHLDYHITMENYLAAKAKLFSMTKLGIFNADDKAGTGLVSSVSCEGVTFGIDSKNLDFRAENLDFHSDAGVEFDAVHEGERCRIKLASAGRFMVYNALAAVSCAVSLGVPFADACRAMCSAPAVPGRLEHVDCGQDFRVIVDYAHSPESVHQICMTAREFTKGKLIVLLGCGGNRDRTKRPIMGAAAGEYGDYIIVTTDNPRFEMPEDIIAEIEPGVKSSGKPYTLIVNRREAIAHAIAQAKPGDTVLLLGKGSETYQEVCGVRSYFSDVDEARKALEGR